MKYKLLDLILLAAIAIGGYLAWRTGAERARLTATYRRLVQVAGDLPIEDPSKVYFQALKTDEPWHFAWRVHTPKNYQQTLKMKSGFGSTSWMSSAGESIARVRIREDNRGQLEIYTHFSGGSSRAGLGDKALADLLRGHWDEVRVEQVGANGVTAIDPEGSAVLLRLTLPDALRSEAEKKLAPHIVAQCVPVLLELRLGDSKKP